MRTSRSAEDINKVTPAVISGAIRVHRTFGSGLLEHAYRACVCQELRAAGLSFECEKKLPLTYLDARVDCAYRADVIVDDVVLLEIKAVEGLAPVHSRQLYTYLRLADCPVGLLLNFGAPTMKDGIKRVVNRFP